MIHTAYQATTNTTRPFSSLFPLPHNTKEKNTLQAQYVFPIGLILIDDHWSIQM